MQQYCIKTIDILNIKTLQYNKLKVERENNIEKKIVEK